MQAIETALLRLLGLRIFPTRHTWATLALASGASHVEASVLANYCGGVVVMKMGTATVSGQGATTDACGSRTERNRDAAFDRLAAAGAELVSTEMVAFEWLRSADHPAFRAVHSLIK